MIFEKLETDPDNIYLQSPKAFHLEMPLYTSFDLSVSSVAEKVFKNISYSGAIDAYCTSCKKESVFHTTEHYEPDNTSPFDLPIDVWLQSAGIFHRAAHVCTRCEHHYYVYYYKEPIFFIKVGQLPSAADFQIPQATKYRKILGEQQYKELTRAIGLAAHGVGIGSFVYLRRIFENQIDKAHEAAKENINEAKYSNARMDEKIQLLSEYLPKFLVENKKLYSILSRGIHALTEEECRSHFEAIKIGIEAFLDEEIRRVEDLEKNKRAREIVQAATEVISNESGSAAKR